MLRRGNYPKEILEKVSEGSRGELELLRYEYEKRSAALCDKLAQLCAAAPDFAQGGEWKASFEKDKELFLEGVDSAIEVMEKMEARVREGLLSNMDEQVVADVSSHELDVLSRLTALQRINSATLQHVFRLSLPARVKELEKDVAAILREAIVTQMEDSQFLSNELQDMAIFIKERNKIITHPLDENHPE